MEKENKGEENIEVSLVFDVNSVIEHINKTGFLQLNERDYDKEDGIDLTELEKRIKEEKFEMKNGLIFDPNKIETKTVNTENGVNLKEEGWEEIGRDNNGFYATLIRRKPNQ
jgi:hypothetical protein